MAQITIYMNNQLEKEIKDMASSLNISISKFISRTLEKTIHDEWSNNSKKLAGSWDDFPTLTEIRDNKKTQDVPREAF